MSEAETPSPSEMARALKELARFRRRVRAARELGIPMPFRRWRRKSLEARLRGLWRGAYVQTDSGDLAYLPAPLEFRRCGCSSAASRRIPRRSASCLTA